MGRIEWWSLRGLNVVGSRQNRELEREKSDIFQVIFIITHNGNVIAIQQFT